MKAVDILVNTNKCITNGSPKEKKNKKKKTELVCSFCQFLYREFSHHG